MARFASGSDPLPASVEAAKTADAGDCFIGEASTVCCLPGLVNVGVQKAGTGELQTWLGVHPAVKVHGGEVHFFDDQERTPSCNAQWRAHLRLRYARFLWKRQRLREADVRGRLLFEKTPAYFDRAQPRQVACAIPAARVLIMLREPAARARSAYDMCQREQEGRWCKAPFAQVVERMLVGGGNGSDAAPLHMSRRQMQRSPHLRRLFFMGHYSTFMRRWLDVFVWPHVGVLWLEQFKADPFACMHAVERFAGLAHHPYRTVATRNEAGLYVVGRSKSDYERKRAPRRTMPTDDAAGDTRAVMSAAAALEAAMVKVRAYYAPSQRRLAQLLQKTNTSLLPELPSPVTGLV
jgi:hypothetical protein